MIGLLYELLVARHLLTKVGEPALSPDVDDAFGICLNGGGGSPPDVLQQYCLTDLVVADPDSLVIIQCKASSAQNNAAITRRELIQILVDASKHLVRIRQGGDARDVTTFLLVSNRSLHDSLGELQDQCAAQLTLAQKTCPQLLLPNDNVVSLEDWCRNQRDHSRNDNPILGHDVAESLEYLVPRFQYARLRVEECQALFHGSLARLGLFQPEINAVEGHLSYRLLQAMQNGAPIGDALKQEFFVGDAFHSFCPRDLQSLKDDEFERRWTATGLPQDFEWVVSESLQRQSLISSLNDELVRMNDGGQRVLVLLGAGGTGKTQVVFSIPQQVTSIAGQEHESHFFAFADGATGAEEFLTRSINYLFDQYRYRDNFLGDRLQSAFYACGHDLKLWVLIPNSDELDQVELSRLVDNVRSSQASYLRFVLTARSRTWNRVGRLGEDLPTVDVGNLDSSELYQWFADRGCFQRSATVNPLPGASGSTLVRPAASRDSVAEGWLSHPLSFGAFRDWISTLPAADQVFHCQGFLDGNEGSINGFCQAAREDYCQRVFKHARLLEVEIAQIRHVFDVLWARRTELHTVPKLEWGAQLCADLFTPEIAVKVIDQFAQVGVIDYTDPLLQHVAWRVPYYVGDGVAQ